MLIEGSMTVTPADLFARLEALGIHTVTVEHPPLFTVEQSKELRGDIPGAHTKNLFLKCKKGTLWLVVAVESTPVNLKTLHTLLGCGRLSFGNAELLGQVLGVQPGSVTPFSVINDREGQVRVVLDEALFDYDRLNFHPLVNTATTGISQDGLRRFLEDCRHPPKILRFEEIENVDRPLAG
jgi:Ala-tRNA(Pro) deacylase